MEARQPKHEEFVVRIEWPDVAQGIQFLFHLVARAAEQASEAVHAEGTMERGQVRLRYSAHAGWLSEWSPDERGEEEEDAE